MHALRVVAVGVLLASGAALGGCSYDETKALRAYDADLAPARHEIEQLRRQQPRIGERRNAERVRQFVTVEILARAARITALLQDVAPPNQHLQSMHRELISIWGDYHDLFTDLALDLTDENLDSRKKEVYARLEALMERFEEWNAHFLAYGDRVGGWG